VDKELGEMRIFYDVTYHKSAQIPRNISVREYVLPLEDWRKIFEAAVDQRRVGWYVLSHPWILNGPSYLWPFRALQAVLLLVWPLGWQYQIFHLCHKRIEPISTLGR